MGKGFAKVIQGYTRIFVVWGLGLEVSKKQGYGLGSPHDKGHTFGWYMSGKRGFNP